jgi:hypothetical protein
MRFMCDPLFCLANSSAPLMEIVMASLAFHRCRPAS